MKRIFNKKDVKTSIYDLRRIVPEMKKAKEGTIFFISKDTIAVIRKWKMPTGAKGGK